MQPRTVDIAVEKFLALYTHVGVDAKLLQQSEIDWVKERYIKLSSVEKKQAYELIKMLAPGTGLIKIKQALEKTQAQGGPPAPGGPSEIILGGELEYLQSM